MDKKNVSDTRRLNHGRGHSYEIDGRKVQGVTSVLSAGLAKPQLIDWASRITAEYAVDRWDELSDLTPSKRLRTLERARWDSTSKAATRGIDVHNLAQRLAETGEADVPEPLTGPVNSYLDFVEKWDPQEVLVETPIFNRTAGYAGTLDLIADLADGARWLLDWKTATSGIWPESAIQLSAYRYCEFWLDEQGKEQPLPAVDFAGCVWLREDGFDLFPVQADSHAFRIFRYAQQLARFAAESKDWRERYVGEALRPPARETA